MHCHPQTEPENSFDQGPLALILQPLDKVGNCEQIEKSSMVASLAWAGINHSRHKGYMLYLYPCGQVRQRENTYVTKMVMTSLQLQNISGQNLAWGDLFGIILKIGLIGSGGKVCSLSQSLPLISFSLDTAALLFQEIQDRIWVASHHPLPRILRMPGRRRLTPLHVSER